MADDSNKPKILVEQWSPTPRVRVLRGEAEEAQARCVDTLRALTRDAEEGRLQGVAVVALRPSDQYTMTWCNVTQANLVRYLGALVVLQNLLCGRAQLTQHGKSSPPVPPPAPIGTVGDA